MQTIKVILLAAAVSLITMASTCKTNKSNSPIENQDQISYKPGDTLIWMERTPCFGYCPWYSVLILHNGNTIYTGKKFVETEGQFWGIMSVKWVDSLKSKARQINYFELNHKYPVEDITIYDVPNTHTYLNMDGQHKKIHNMNMQDQENERAYKQFMALTKFESLIDSALSQTDLNPVEFIPDDKD